MEATLHTEVVVEFQSLVTVLQGRRELYQLHEGCRPITVQHRVGGVASDRLPICLQSKRRGYVL